ncbi:MAG TPA: phage holin family protein [Gemmatimonadales bacterium]|nr:phage holin family protein [Gemmatimonadales bacterium]
MRSLLLHWILNAVALWGAAALVPGLEFRGGVGRLLLVAAVFGIVNSTLRPLLTILTCPLIIVTLGLFTLVINALMLLVTGWVSESWNLGFTVTGFWAAFWGGLAVGLVSMILSLLLPAAVTRPYGSGVDATPSRRDKGSVR